MHRDRPADDGVMRITLHISPALINHNFFRKSYISQLLRDAAYLRGGYACCLLDLFRGIFLVQIFLSHQLEYRHRLASVSQRDLTFQRRFNTFGIIGALLFFISVPDKSIALIITGKQPVISAALIADDKPWCIGVAAQIINIDFACRY